MKLSRPGGTPSERAPCSIWGLAGAHGDLALAPVGRAQPQQHVALLGAADQVAEQEPVGFAAAVRSDHGRDGDRIDGDDVVSGADPGGYGGAPDGKADSGEIVLREGEAGAAAGDEGAVAARRGDSVPGPGDRPEQREEEGGVPGEPEQEKASRPEIGHAPRQPHPETRLRHSGFGSDVHCHARAPYAANDPSLR